MGKVRVRPETGRLQLDFTYRNKRCREQTALQNTPENLKKVELLLKRIEAEITLGTFNYQSYFPESKQALRFESAAKSPSYITPESGLQSVKQASPNFSDFANEWFEESEVGWRRTHRKTVRGTLDKHLIPEFGKKAVDQITKADILKLRSSLAKVPGRKNKEGLSATRINHILTPLRMILNEAADRFNFNTPYQNIKSLKEPRTDIEPFTLEEVNRILATVRPDFKDYYVVRFFTGMRTGEIDGLKWKYVDFSRRVIMVRETVVMGEDDQTKTDGSRRDIVMSEPVFQAMERQYQRTGKRSIYAFCNREGQPLDNKNVTNRVWYPLLRNLGMAKRRPYQTRHTAATLWLGAGENPEWIARQLGHTTTEMLFRVYSRYVPNLTRQDGSAFERLLAASIHPITSTEQVALVPAKKKSSSRAPDRNACSQPDHL